MELLQGSHCNCQDARVKQLISIPWLTFWKVKKKNLLSVFSATLSFQTFKDPLEIARPWIQVFFQRAMITTLLRVLTELIVLRVFLQVSERVISESSDLEGATGFPQGPHKVTNKLRVWIWPKINKWRKLILCLTLAFVGASGLFEADQRKPNRWW